MKIQAAKIAKYNLKNSEIGKDNSDVELERSAHALKLSNHCSNSDLATFRKCRLSVNFPS